MRIPDPMVRSGYFWPVGKEDKMASGTLTISDGGKVSLEILGSFSGPTETVEDFQDETMMIGRVVGQIEKEGPVTLEHCHYQKRSFAFGGVTKSQVKAGWAPWPQLCSRRGDHFRLVSHRDRRVGRVAPPFRHDIGAR